VDDTSDTLRTDTMEIRTMVDQDRQKEGGVVASGSRRFGRDCPRLEGGSRNEPQEMQS